MKSYLKFLSRNKLYTAVEAVGLIVSIAFVVLIGNYVWQRYRMAHENPIGDRVYTVMTDTHVGLSWWDKASFEEQLPEIEAACRIGTANDETLHIGEKAVQGLMRYVDASFFDLCPNVELLAGSLEAYAQQGGCLISESFARNNFAGDPLGRQLVMRDLFTGGQQTLTVCGIFSDLDNTLLGRNDLLINAQYDTMSGNRPFSTRGQYLTLLKVPADADIDLLTEKLVQVCKKNWNNWGWGDETMFEVVRFDELSGLEGQYFVISSNPAMQRMLLVVVLLLLVSAIFNYVNLNTARSGRRAKEMAMRRLLGSQRPAIFAKYIGESILFTLLCTALALLAAEALRPMVDMLLQNVAPLDSDDYDTWQYISLQLDYSPQALAVYLVSALLIGTLVGLVPAVMAMRYAPIDVVRGTFRRRTKMLFSKLFIIFQHTISVALIALSLAMELQMHHLLSRPLHGRTDGLYMLEFWIRTYDDVRPLIDRLSQTPGIGRIGMGHGFPSSVSMSTFFIPTNNSEIRVQANFILCDDTYFDLLGLEKLDDFQAPRVNTIWVSESLANVTSLADSLQTLSPRFININGALPETYGGIYRNIPVTDASRESNDIVHSMIIIGDRERLLYAHTLLIEVTGDRRAVVEAIRKAYADYYVEKNGLYNAPSREGYLDDVIAGQLRPLKMSMRFVELFMVLSVLISLLGLLAMSTYYAGENTKQIAIRKVFGSNVLRELWRTVRDYMLLVAVAVAIGIPLAVWASARYLERFAYRIEGYGWIFVAAAVISVAIAFASVLGQTLRAARTNPASELKKE